ETKFQFLTTLCGIHYPEQKTIAVMYQLHNLVSNFRIRLKAFLPEDKPVVQTLTGVFSAANWMERETYDFFGVVFEGHPNLKRILNVEEMIIFPLRKEYPLEDQVREDKNDAMFGR
ncbi:MAG TPA: NADH-quinone oxidoreductase subunit C, partial [Cyclobacteriaceae bacterium]|nr:NADH-quinone oxidoreductase subunit C [Cyclobacteriaceae bacterium]